jgi:parallel beta-helix repeat protein
VGTGCAASQTGSPIDVSDSGATVTGRLLSSTGGQVEYWVQYGLTTAYGSENGHQTVDLEQNVPHTVIVGIAGLARSTAYHYRLCARDSQQTGGPGCGADRTFTTQSFACGETVTTSVRLTGHVACEEFGVGLFVGADGIDINLAGYSLSTPTGVGGGSDAIRNDGHDDVTIRNGSLVGATHLTDASRNLIRNVDAFGGGDVIRIEGGQGNAVRWSTLSARGSGIAAVDSDDLVAVGNRASGGLGPGIQVDGDRARIVHNQLPANNATFAAGIHLFGSDGRVVDNHVTGPWLGGGILLRAGANNVIAENEVSDAGDDTPPFDDNFNDGIFVGAFSAGTLLRDNVVQRNTGDGIEVQASNARLGGNRAFDNGDFGIDAAAGVTDLGGNVATGNGNPLQCRNVFCL